MIKVTLFNVGSSFSYETGINGSQRCALYPLPLSVLHFTSIQSYGYTDQKKVATDVEVTGTSRPESCALANWATTAPEIDWDWKENRNQYQDLISHLFPIHNSLACIFIYLIENCQSTYWKNKIKDNDAMQPPYRNASTPLQDLSYLVTNYFSVFPCFVPNTKSH